MRARPQALKASVSCLTRTLCAMDASGAWAPVTQPFRLLLEFTMDINPKVRKLAVDGLTELLAIIQPTPALHHASAELVSGVPHTKHIFTATLD